MKKIAIVYDDRALPSDEIRSITGEKSFGNTIYKRKSLREMQLSYLSDRSLRKYGIADKMLVWDSSGSPSLKDMPAGGCVFHIFSDCAVKDVPEFYMLLRKALFAKENYRMGCGKKTAALIFKSLEDWTEATEAADTTEELRALAEPFSEISNEAFCDISEKDGFLSFITSGFEARYFNALSGDRHSVVKKSSNVKKIQAEYQFYKLLPEEMQPWFVQPYSYKEERGLASYTMERYHMTDLAIRYVHGAIETSEFERILENVFRYLKIRKEKELSWEEFFSHRKELYIGKLEKRIEDLKSHPEYNKLNNLIISGTDFNGIDAIVDKYIGLYDERIGKVKEKVELVVSHGDLCFSNILYSRDTDLMRLIDPKGAQREEELYTDPYYDLAKLSHSIAGGYDFMNSGRYEICLDEGLKLKLNIDGDNSEYIELFRKKAEEEGYDYGQIRLFETSLFLSMLPLHIDRPQKVLSFILNALSIMEELERA